MVKRTQETPKTKQMVQKKRLSKDLYCKRNNYELDLF
jgi:hypothetical protein